jgi:hypothetical protein
MHTLSWRHCALLSALPLWACAQSDLPVPTAEPGVRIVVTMSVGEMTTRTANLARVPLRDVMELAPQRYRITLVCPDDAACRAAVARIAADRSFALGVDIEGRQQIPTRPSRDASR